VTSMAFVDASSGRSASGCAIKTLAPRLSLITRFGSVGLSVRPGFAPGLACSGAVWGRERRNGGVHPAGASGWPSSSSCWLRGWRQWGLVPHRAGQAGSIWGAQWIGSLASASVRQVLQALKASGSSVGPGRVRLGSGPDRPGLKPAHGASSETESQQWQGRHRPTVARADGFPQEREISVLGRCGWPPWIPSEAISARRKLP